MTTIDFSLMVASVMALVEVAKGFKLPTKFCPVLAIIVGILVNFGVGTIGGIWPEKLFYGVLIGLSAAGTYDIVKNPVVATKKLITKAVKKP